MRAAVFGMVLVMLAVSACARRSTPRASGEDAVGSAGAVATDAAGHRYTIMRIPKSQAVQLDAHTVRGPLGVPLEIVREDADAYQVKMYESASAPAAGKDESAIAAPGPSSGKDDTPRTPTSRRLRFRSFGAGLPTSGQWRDGFSLADMNGDGHLDIVHGPARKSPGTPVIFLGDGRGTWRRWSEARFPPQVYDYGDALAADLNGDGHADVVLAMHLHGLRALLGDGRGGFTDASTGLDFAAQSRDATFTSHAIALTDWDGDGRLDVIALSEGPRLTPGTAAQGSGSAGVKIYLQRGARWQRRDDDAPRPIFGSSVSVGDFDGDGRPDFATSSGVFGRTDLVNLRRADAGWTPTSVPVPPAYVSAVAARDLDGDGRADLVVGYLARAGTDWRTALDVLCPRPGGGWERRPLFAADGRTGVRALAVGDLDGDGHADVVALTGDGDTLAFTGDGHGGFTRQVDAVPRFPGACQGAHVVLADLDGDGRDEIVASFAEERSSVSEADRCPSAGGITVWQMQ